MASNTFTVAISEHNRIIKYADDTTLLVADKSSVDVATEFGHLEDWSRRNKLTINVEFYLYPTV